MILLAVYLMLGFYVEPIYPTTLVHPPFGHCMGIYRAGTEQLAILLGGLVRFDNPQGLACVKLEAWDKPGPGDDDELAVYGVNSGSGHIIYNADMYSLGLYGGTGSGENQLSEPHGIAADPYGTVIVADTGNGRVVVLRRRGQRLLPDGLVHGDFEEPWDVALDGSGGVYVTDRSAGLLYMYSSRHDSMPATVAIESPTGVDAVRDEEWFYDDSGEFAVVVAEDASALLKVADGEITARISVEDFGGRMLNYPVIDFWGNIWVTDSLACTVHKFTEDLEYLGSFGSRGHGDREFWYPTGIAVWKRFGQFFIAEREGARYFWVGADLIDMEIAAGGRSLSVRGTLTEGAVVKAMIYGTEERPVFRLAERRFPAGEMLLEWDGRTSRGIPVPGGEYRLELTLEPTYSSRGYFSKSVTGDFTLEYVEIESRRGG